MLRTFKIAVFSAALTIAACKQADKSAATKQDPSKPTDPAKPADPATKPADPAAPSAAAPPAMAPPAAATGQNTELENRGLAVMQKMGDLFAANAKDCDKLAVEIKAFIAVNKPLFTQLTAFEKSQSEADKQAFENRNRQAAADVMKKMQPAVETCHDNKNVEAAMKEFPAD